MDAVALIVSVSVLFFLAPLAVIRNVSAGEPYYEYLQYVLQNPRTLSPNSAVSDRFTIHGLWPTNYSGYAYVEYCNQWKHDFESRYQLTSDIQADLSYSWPDAFDPEQNFDFWDKQYHKHGSCTKLVFPTPEHYFTKAEALYHELDLDAVFSNGGIGPGQPFPTATYMNLIQTEIGGFQPRLLCDSQALKEVVLCYNKDASARITCRKESTCQGDIYFPR